MPQGGQISAGSGIRLQATTPGVTDIGNQNINGHLIAGNTIEPLTQADPYRLNAPVPGASCMVIGTNPSFVGGGSTNQRQDGTICIGRGQTIQMNPNGNGDKSRIMIGDTITTYGGNGISIGQNVTNGNSAQWPNPEAAGVAIGLFASCLTQSAANIIPSVAIGSGAGDQQFANQGSTCIGAGARSNNALGFNIVVGLHYSTGGTNNIIIANGGTTGLTLSASNTILIGDSSHTNLTIGKLDFTNVIYTVAYRQTTTQTVTNTTTATTIIGAGLGSLATGPSLTIGKTYRLHARGDIQTNGAGQTLALIASGFMPSFSTTYGMVFNRVGGNVITLPNIASPTSWELDIECRVVVAGGNGTPPIGRVVTTGSFSINVDGAAPLRWNTGITGQQYADTSDAFTWDIQATWGSASANNILNCIAFTLEQVGL